MPPITLRLRLSIAALTVAAVTSGAFLVSSAPAQTKPTPPVLTPQELQYRAQQKQDLTNLIAIGLALVRYSSDHPNLRQPDADHWVDQIAPYLPDRSVLFSPFEPGTHRYGYAFNRNCSKQPIFAFNSAQETVIVFDSTLGTKNASDTGASLRINPGPSKSQSMRFAPGSNYVFIDGHAKFFRQGIRPSFSLKGGDPTESYSLADRATSLRQINVKLTEQGTVKRIREGKEAEPDQAQFLAGLTPVQGPGVIVTLTDSKKPFPQKLPPGMTPPSVIHDGDINQVVNELKAGGAEAISVNGQRLVATSAVRVTGATILINNTPQIGPFVVKAIGDPKTLAGALALPGGIAGQIKSYDRAMFAVQQAPTLTLAAYAGGGGMRYARPIDKAESQKHLMMLMTELAKSQANYALSQQRVSDSVHAMLPQADPRTLTKIVMLEERLAQLTFNLQFAKNYLTRYQTDQALDEASIAMLQGQVSAKARGDITKLKAEETKAFSATGNPSQYFKSLHALSAQMVQRKSELHESRIQTDQYADLTLR